MTASLFSAENIVKILEAVPRGGAVRQIAERAGGDVSANTLERWLRRGKRDRDEGKQTSYRILADQWDTLHPGKPARYEEGRMAEMRKGLEQLGIKHRETPIEPRRGERDRPRITRVCECGNPKASAATACADCLKIEGERAAT